MTGEFDELYYGSYARVLRTVLLVLPAREDAQDVVHEAYARALARWPRVRRLDDPEAWIRRVAVNAALDVHRRERSRRSALRRLGRPVEVPEANGDRVDVSRGLRSLKPAQREVIVRYYLLDQTVAQVASDTGRPVGTVKTLLARGRAALVESLRIEEDVSHG